MSVTQRNKKSETPDFNKSIISENGVDGLSTKSKNSVSFLIISVITFLLLVALSGCFPYTGDDWAWGSESGIMRLESFFDNYNGRYLGNLLILAISRSKILAVSTMAVSYYAVCWLCYKYCGINKNIVFVFSVMSFFIMSRALFMQSVVWASGFSNYVPSAILSLCYILLIKNVTEKNSPCYPKLLFIVTFLLGICGALFIENVTIFNVILGFAVIIYVAVKFKKVYAVHISFLMGAVIGFLIMFSNSAYTSITGGVDSYRDVPLNLSELFLRCAGNGYKIFDYVVNSNYPICIVVSFLLLLLSVTTIKKFQTKRKKALISTVVINAFSLLLIIYCKKMFNISSEEAFDNIHKLMLEIIVAALYVLTVMGIIQMCIPSKDMLKILLPLFCIPVSVAPLLIVSPLGPRCFFVSYLFIMVFTVNLFGYIINSINITLPIRRLLASVVWGVTVVEIVVYAAAFVPIHKYDVKRTEFAQQQSADNKKQIIISSLPNSDYIWMETPIEEPWITRYKSFYGLNKDSAIKVVSPEELDEYYEKYKK